MSTTVREIERRTQPNDRPATKPGAGRGGKRPTAGDVVVGYVSEQVETLQAYDPRVRRDEPDAVHKMRVATRRIRTALQTFGKVVDKQATRDLRNELRWLATALGDVRDLDVLHDTVSTHLDGLATELVVGPVRARLSSETASTRTGARDGLLETMSSPRYYALLDAANDLVENAPFTRLAARPAHRALKKPVRRAWKRVDRGLAAAGAAPEGTERDEAIHEARKAAKRARYAAETVTPVFGRPARRFASTMEDLQDLLGAHQDSVVAREALRGMGVRAQLAGENAFTFGLLYGVEQARATSVEQDLGAATRRARKKKHRRWAT
jgi:CHAD domain-containing protein